MILRVYNCDYAEIDLFEHVALIEVEHPGVLTAMLADIAGCEHPARELAIDHDGRQLKPADIFCVSDYMSGFPSDRAFTGRLHKHLDEALRSDPVARLNFDNLIAGLRAGISDIIHCTNVDLTLADSVAPKDIFAALRLVPDYDACSVEDKLRCVIDIAAETRCFKVLALVQPRAFLTAEQLASVYKHALGARIGLVVFEGRITDGKSPLEKKICIGADFSDMML